MKDRNTAGILAILLGGVGIHKFYLGRGLQGLIYLLFCWTFLPAILGVVEGIIYLTMSEQAFHAKYNPGYGPGYTIAPAQPQNIVVNVANTAGSTPSGSTIDVTAQLRSLASLRADGVLTDAEFETQKQKLLASG
jgi:TM2 domain-containing membrane protein YozV